MALRLACLQQLPNHGYGAALGIFSNSSSCPSFLQIQPHLLARSASMFSAYCCSPSLGCYFHVPSARHKVSDTFGCCKSSCGSSFSNFSAENFFVCTPSVTKTPGSAGQCLSHRQALRPLMSLVDEVSYPEDPKTENRHDYQQESRTTAMVHIIVDQKLNNCIRFTAGILEMSRLHNVLPSMALVFLGSWMAAGRTMGVFLRSSVWLTATCSALITVASMLANDIFDYRSGTDSLNGKSTPLLRGQVHPDDVELVAGCLYSAVVICLCYLEPVNLRLLIGGAAVATYIYTPFLKKLTVMKNVVVSGVIASSILAGAMVIGGKGQLENPIIAVAVFFFLCIFSREVLMDVQDIVGDQAAGVNTLAVRFGGRVGTLTASLCLAAANALLIGFLAVKAKYFATIGTLSLLPLHTKILQLNLRKGVSDLIPAETGKSIKQIIEQSMLHIGLGVLVLASAA